MMDDDKSPEGARIRDAIRKYEELLDDHLNHGKPSPPMPMAFLKQLPYTLSRAGEELLWKRLDEIKNKIFRWAGERPPRETRD